MSPTTRRGRSRRRSRHPSRARLVLVAATLASILIGREGMAGARSTPTAARESTADAGIASATGTGTALRTQPMATRSRTVPTATNIDLAELQAADLSGSASGPVPPLVTGERGLSTFVMIGFTWPAATRPTAPQARVRVHGPAGWTEWITVSADHDTADHDTAGEDGGDPHSADPKTTDGEPTDSEPAESDPADHDGAIDVSEGGVNAARVTSDPLWVGEADGWELQPGNAALPVKVHLVGPGGAGQNDDMTSLQQRVPPMTATAPPATGVAWDGSTDPVLQPAGSAADRPAINPRAGWGARPAAAGGWVAKQLRLAVVHHSGSGESASYGAADVPAMLRAMQAYHMDANGWIDLGYNFVVDRFGRIWEGRAGGIDALVIGAHAYGLNTASVGVMVLGDHRSEGPSTAAMDGVAAVLAWKLFRHGADPGRSAVALPRATDRYPALQPVELPRIIGHQDVNATSCPGTIEALLPALRQAVIARYHVLIGTASVSDTSTVLRGTDGTALMPVGQPLVLDANGDGRQDVLWYRPGPTPEELWLSAGLNMTMSRMPYILEDGGITASLTALDWDGDGVGDVLATVPGRSTATLLRGRRAGAPEAVPLGAVEVGIGTVALGGARALAGDFDGDGDHDVLFADQNRTTWALLSFNGIAATTTMVGSTSVNALGVGPHRPVVGDFDGDLRDDVLWYGPGGTSDTVWYGRSVTGSAPFDAVNVTMAGDHQPLVADLNGDQRDDVVWRTATAGTAASPAAMRWWAGQRQRGFIVGEFTMGSAELVDAADLDGGGSADLVVRHDASTASTASVRLQQGANERVTPTAPVPHRATPLLADFDGDGRRELWWWNVAGDTALWRTVR